MLLSLEKWRLRGDFFTLYKNLKGGCRQKGLGFFSQLRSNRMRENGFKLYQGRLRQDRREKFVNERAVRHWIRLPRKWWNHHPWNVPETSVCGIWGHGEGVNTARLKVGLEDLRGLFQP